jgi:hypothetical protein
MAEALAALKSLGPQIWPGKFLIADKAEFNWRTAPWVHYESFEDFYDRELAPIYGDYEEFVRNHTKMIHGEISAEQFVDRINAVDAADAAVQQGNRQGARTDLFDNIQEVKAPTGTSQSAALRRLRNNKPELHARVLAGELSPHAAMVQAGYRPRTITIRADDAESIVRTLRRQLDPDVARRVAKLFAEEETS